MNFIVDKLDLINKTRKKIPNRLNLKEILTLLLFGKPYLELNINWKIRYNFSEPDLLSHSVNHKHYNKLYYKGFFLIFFDKNSFFLLLNDKRKNIVTL